MPHLNNGSIRLPEEVSVALTQAAQVQRVDGHMGALLSHYSGYSPRGFAPSRLFLGPDVIIYCHLVRQSPIPQLISNYSKNCNDQTA